MKTGMSAATDALCAQVDPELFFPDSSGSYYSGISDAKRLCSTCPLTERCLVTALENREEWGIWGGTTPSERRNISTKQQAKEYVIKLRRHYAKEANTNKRKRLRRFYIELG